MLDRIRCPANFPITTRRGWITCLLILTPLALLAAAPVSDPPRQRRLLNPLDAPALPGIGGWMVDDLTVRPAAGIEPRFGSTAIEIMAKARRPGGKVDAPLFDGHLPDCRQLSLWVAPQKESNVTSVGFQVRDSKGEWLMQTVPVDWTGWKRIDLDTAGGGMRPAYEQKDHDGRVDLPLTSVRLVFFAAEAGPTSLRIDGFSAAVEASPHDAGLTVTRGGGEMVEPDAPLALRFTAENRGAGAKGVSLRYTLQANPTYADPPVPDRVLGHDHAAGARSTVSVDGVDKGDARLCDGDEVSAFETPWGTGYKAAVATIDLGQIRDVRAVHWRAGDANWVFKCDVLASLDGVAFNPVAGAQGVDLHGKWGGPHAFPWPGATRARFLRLRFHKDDQPANQFRLPAAVMVYDGIDNDRVAVPQVGPVVATGSADASVPAHDFAEVVARVETNPGPGAYLLGQEWSIDGRTETRWSHLFVLPTGSVAPEAARRFGINAARTAHAESMRRCGFGWVRYENAKWQMYMPRRDHAAFDGTVAPWHLNYDQIFGNYQRLGMRVLPYVFQPPEWATGAPADVRNNRAGYPPKDPADYGDAVFQLVARFGRAKVDPSLLKTADKQSGLGLIDAVELWNEPNLNDPGWGPFVGSMAQYFEVMRAGAQGARKADPSLPVSAAGLAGIDLETVGQLAEHRYADGKTPLDLVDIVNVHFYSGRDEPETAGFDPNVHRSGPAGAPATTGGTTYPEQLEELVAWRDRLKPKAEIWMTETGNDVGGPIGRGERHQAAKLPRAVTFALAAGVDRVFVYRESGSDPAMHAGAGLLRNDASVRPAWLTVATMIRQLQGLDGRALRLPSPDPGVWAYLWQQGDRRVVAAWALGEPRRFGVDLGKSEVCDGFGRTTAASGTADVLLGDVPTYIAVSEPGPDFEKLVAGAKADADRRAAERRRLAELPVRLFDFGPAAHVGMLKGFGPPRRFAPVGKDARWDDQLGYGFAAPAAGDEDAHWISDALERDGCRVQGGNPFRFRLGPGRHALRVRASAMQAGKPLEVRVQAAGAPQRGQVGGDASVAEFIVEGGDQPVEVSLGEWGILRWISAVPEEAAKR